MTREDIFHLATKAENIRFELGHAESLALMFVELRGRDEKNADVIVEYGGFDALHSFLSRAERDMQELQDALYEEARKVG